MLNTHIEVVNQRSKMGNYTHSYETKSIEADILRQSVVISNKLFRSARADYLEELLTQREALDARLELIEIKLKNSLNLRWACIGHLAGDGDDMKYH